MREFNLSIAKAVNIVLDPDHGSQILCTQMQIRLGEPSKGKKQPSANFRKNGKIRSNEV